MPRKLLTAVLALLSVTGVVAGLWFTYAEQARATREAKTPEQIAGSRGRWLPAADAQLYIREWGSEQHPIVLLTHGTGAWSGTWFGLPEALSAAGWRVVAVDLPPFGLSKLPAESVDYTRQAQAQRILGLIDALGRPVNLVGHSFGAGPALEAALQAHGQVRQLVLVDLALGLGNDGSAPLCEPGSGQGWLASARGVRTALVSSTATLPALTGTMLKQFVHRKEVVTEALTVHYQGPFERQEFSARLGDWAMAFSASSCEAAASQLPEQLSAWAARGTPLSLIWGEEDSITPLAQARALKAWMPAARLEVLPGVGHIAHIESPDAFATALIKVLGPPPQPNSGAR